MKKLATVGTTSGRRAAFLQTARWPSWLMEHRPSPLEGVLGLGLLWLAIGMLVMPSSISFNPGRAYQISLAVLVYLPALYLVLRHHARLWRELWPLPAFRVFLLLLTWATLSLLWGSLRHPGDEACRLLSVLLFVLGWHAWAGHAPRRAIGLLEWAGWGMAACALVYSAIFLTQGHGEEDRIAAGGVVATANYAAAAMGAACVWLVQLPRQRWQQGAATLAALSMLLLFVVLTQSRGVWLALAACAMLVPLWRSGRAPKVVALLVLLMIIAAMLWPWPVLLERGASHRPQILAQALRMIDLHPWRGLGQGAPFVIEADGEHLTHSHNVLTQTAIELGLPGLALLVALWLAVAWSGWRHRDDPLGRVVLGLWVYATVVLQFDMPQLLDSPRPGWLLIWLPLALALGLEVRGRTRPLA